MAEQEREKLFVEIITSLQEYTNENITDQEAIKSEIVDLLKTHRPVKLTDWEYGLSKVLKKDHQIIVKEKEDEKQVRIFLKPYFYCSNRPSHTKCNSSLKIKFGIVFAPISHGKKCKAKNYSFVMEIQDLLKHGKTKEAIYKMMVKRRPTNNDSSLSVSTSILNDTDVSTTTDMENETNLEQSISENTNTSIDSNSSPSSQQQQSSHILEEVAPESSAARSSVKTENEDQDYCMVIVEPAAKRPKIESGNSEETFAFDHPSASVLKKVCGKLNIEYSHDAYQLWANIIFNDISASSDNIQTHELKSPNIYACLSLFFTGKTDNSFLIQHFINTAFRDASDSLTRAEINQMFTSATVTDEQIKFIASFLSCRIGIYHGSNLNKYGNWKDENIALTLILSFIDGMYSIVLDL
uniref:SPK domain-containing protein n=1 Tax=Panagrolaimus superbus TaxID=310955 RepID=A0A914YDB1_9BILA